MFNLKMKDATLLKNLLTAMATLIDEARFFVTADKISLREMDPSRVAMVDFEWPKTIFDEYNADEGKICVNISELLKLLRRAGKEDSLQLSLDEKTGKLIIVIKGKYTRTFNIPTLEPGEEEVPVPKVTFNVNARVDVTALKDALEDATLVSDHVRFEAESDKLTMNAQGDLMGAAIEFQKGNDALIKLEVKEPSKATFSLAYLTEIMKACNSLAAVATLEFSTDMPVKIDFEQKEGKLAYYLAPRIEVE